MFTIFHVFRLAGFACGIGLGYFLGHSYFGILGGLIASIPFAALGFMLSGIPEQLVLRGIRLTLGQKSTDQIRAELHAGSCLIVNIYLLELRRRGEDISTEIPFLLDLLCDESRERRIRGWAALASAFPELAAQIPKYNINDTPAKCQSHVALLRKEAP